MVRDGYQEAPPHHEATATGNLRMTAETDAKLIEQGRKLFAGDWQFFWASPSIETLPPMAGIEVAFAGRSNVGKSSLINALTGRNALARTSHTPGRTQELIFFEGPDEGRLPAGRHARLRLCLRAQGQGRVMDRADPQVPAGPQQPGAGLCADRCPAWPQGGRSRRAEDPRQIGRELSGGADQGRPGQAGRAGKTRRAPPRPR